MFILVSLEQCYIYTSIADMRNGINGLSGLVNQYQKRQGNKNEIYIFINRQKTIMKLYSLKYKNCIKLNAQQYKRLLITDK